MFLNKKYQRWVLACLQKQLKKLRQLKLKSLVIRKWNKMRIISKQNSQKLQMDNRTKRMQWHWKLQLPFLKSLMLITMALLIRRKQKTFLSTNWRNLDQPSLNLIKLSSINSLQLLIPIQMVSFHLKKLRNLWRNLWWRYEHNQWKLLLQWLMKSYIIWRTGKWT